MVHSELSEELEVKVAMHQGTVLSPFPFTFVVGIVTELAIKGAQSELLYVDDLVLMSESHEGLIITFIKLDEAFVSMGLKVNFLDAEVMVCGDITRDGLSKSKVDPCGACSLRVKANSVLFLQCGNRIHSRCTGVKMVSA